MGNPIRGEWGWVVGPTKSTPLGIEAPVNSDGKPIPFNDYLSALPGYETFMEKRPGPVPLTAARPEIENPIYLETKNFATRIARGISSGLPKVIVKDDLRLTRDGEGVQYLFVATAYLGEERANYSYPTWLNISHEDKGEEADLVRYTRRCREIMDGAIARQSQGNLTLERDGARLTVRRR